MSNTTGTYTGGTGNFDVANITNLTFATLGIVSNRTALKFPTQFP
jgi:hypothetical protein